MTNLKSDTFTILGVQPPDKRVIGGTDSPTPQPIPWVQKTGAFASAEPTGGGTVVRNPLHTSANYDPDWNK